MTARKSERLLNLLIMLLVQRHFVSKGRIREILYPGQSDEAFERMFDRDKEELRSIGVPIEVGTLDAYFDDEPGYRVRSAELTLPEISLEADEAAVIGVATKVWEHARLAEATAGAVAKLRAAGVSLDEAALEIAEPRLSADEPAFDTFWEATRDRTPLCFDYRRPGRPVERRRLRPWGVVRSSGRWYAVGYDPDRDAERVFRLSRVDAVTTDGPAGAYAVPAGVDLQAIVGRLAPAPLREPAVLLVRAGAAAGLRRRAELQATGVPGPDGDPGWDPGWDRLAITEAHAALADEVLSHGPDVVVVAPPALRTAVVTRLRAAVGEAS